MSTRSNRSSQRERRKPLSAEEQIKEREFLFPGTRILDTDQVGYVPLHWVFRNQAIQELFSAPSWRIFCIILMRLNPQFYYRIETKDIATVLGKNSNKYISPYLTRLSELGFLKIKVYRRRQYILAPDPLSVVHDLIKNGVIAGGGLSDLVKDCWKYRVDIFTYGSRDSNVFEEGERSSSISKETQSNSSTTSKGVEWGELDGEHDSDTRK